MSNVNVKLPYDIIGIIGAHKNIENESKILIATELYREGEISSGKAAELADLPFEDFISELKNRKMKKLRLSVEMLQEILYFTDDLEKWVLSSNSRFVTHRFF
ncbi:MAG: UPF0175 family protein [Methanosarcinales archaeon]|nr:UPF0175 family protein [Methanosarcinales archaeon]